MLYLSQIGCMVSDTQIVIIKCLFLLQQLHNKMAGEKGMYFPFHEISVEIFRNQVNQLYTIIEWLRWNKLKLSDARLSACPTL